MFLLQASHPTSYSLFASATIPSTSKSQILFARRSNSALIFSLSLPRGRMAPLADIAHVTRALHKPLASVPPYGAEHLKGIGESARPCGDGQGLNLRQQLSQNERIFDTHTRTGAVERAAGVCRVASHPHTAGRVCRRWVLGHVEDAILDLLLGQKFHDFCNVRASSLKRS
jgi:hypothetical protein